MALGDDEVIACGCGFDDVSFPHDCNPIRRKVGRDFLRQLILKQLHEAVGMAHAGSISTQEDGAKELFFELSAKLDEIIEEVEQCENGL